MRRKIAGERRRERALYYYKKLARKERGKKLFCSSFVGE
jgi:hypothetical protein